MTFQWKNTKYRICFVYLSETMSGSKILREELKSLPKANCLDREKQQFLIKSDMASDEN